MSDHSRMLVLGLGASGRAAALFALAHPERFSAVRVLDSSATSELTMRAAELRRAGAEVLLGTDAVEGEWDVCVASPGIPPAAPVMQAARNTCREIISEIELAYRESSAPWVAITGTNGKTTTTALVAHLLRTAGVDAREVGNIGTPAIEVAQQRGADHVMVAEVSSFQLALTRGFRPRVAVLLNVTPDHVDWHGSLECYAADKARVFANLTAEDTAVIDVDDPGSARFAEPLAARGVRVVRVSRDELHPGGASVVEGALALDTPDGVVKLAPAGALRILGGHNISNALAAAAAAHAMGAGVDPLAEGLTSFEPIEHRLEPVAVISGVEWFNDSKATNPDAVSKAVAAFDERPLVLMLGGRNKGNDFTDLAVQAARVARAVVVFGEAGVEIASAFAGTGAYVIEVETLGDAVTAAAAEAQEGDAVLLSPACASYDQFANFEERGRAFKALVLSRAGEARA